ncbi:MFS transporter [Jonesia quinghaiensis]|uniref:MFS transporter n=1 Tax=Jonesia quinghaiensis TaxID=262806 RepID=UPI000687BE5A|nr:MFS transporter [Jonesia quinghaiensis]
MTHSHPQDGPVATSRNPYAVVYSVPGAARFSVAGALARSPMSMVGIGIVLMIQSAFDSYELGGRISAAYIIAQAVCSPQLARLVDRYGQARVMRPAVAATALSLTSLITATVMHAPIPLLYLFAITSGMTIGSVGAMVRARWSHVVKDPKKLHTAYSLEAAIDEMIFVIGPVVATVLAASVAFYAGLIVPIVLMVIGGFWFLSQRDTEPPLHVYDVADTNRSVLRSPAMVSLILVFIGVGSLFGATDVSTIAFAEEQGNKALGGVILGIFALGSCASGLAYGARQWASAVWLRYLVGIIGLAIGASLFFVATNLWVLAGVMFVTGLTISPTLINVNAMVQLVVSPRQLTEGFTWVGTALGVGVAAGSSLAGTQIDTHGAHAGFSVVVASAALAVVVAVASIGIIRKSTTVTERLIDEIPERDLTTP